MENSAGIEYHCGKIGLALAFSARGADGSTTFAMHMIERAVLTKIPSTARMVLLKDT
jgi:hypothetical protein